MGSQASDRNRVKLYQDVGLRVRLRRSLMQLSQQEVAHKVNISPQMLNQIEAGYMPASCLFLNRYAKLCQVPVTWFFRRDKPDGGSGKPIDHKKDLTNVVAFRGNGSKSRPSKGFKRAA